MKLLQNKTHKNENKKITEMKAQWSIGKWIKLEAWIGAELTHPSWRTRPAFVSWARRWDRRWIVASDPFGFLGIRVFFRAGNVSKRGGKLRCVRTAGENRYWGFIYRRRWRCNSRALLVINKKVCGPTYMLRPWWTSQPVRPKWIRGFMLLNKKCGFLSYPRVWESLIKFLLDNNLVKS